MICLNDDLRLHKFTVIAWYDNEVWIDKHQKEGSSDRPRKYHIPNESPLQLEEANDMWSRGLLIKATRKIGDRTEILFKSSKQALASNPKVTWMPPETHAAAKWFKRKAG